MSQPWTGQAEFCCLNSLLEYSLFEFRIIERTTDIMKVLVTGSAGFIGSALSLRLLERGDEVIGIDNLNDYYDIELKKSRLARTLDHAGYTDVRIDLEDRAGIAELFRKHKPHRVVNLAAQAGVRYSIENPLAYVDTNLLGFANILEGCRHMA